MPKPAWPCQAKRMRCSSRRCTLRGCALGFHLRRATGARRCHPMSMLVSLRQVRRPSWSHCPNILLGCVTGSHPRHAIDVWYCHPMLKPISSHRVKKSRWSHTLTVLREFVAGFRPRLATGARCGSETLRSILSRQLRKSHSTHHFQSHLQGYAANFHQRHATNAQCHPKPLRPRPGLLRRARRLPRSHNLCAPQGCTKADHLRPATGARRCHPMSMLVSLRQVKRPCLKHIY